MTNILEKFYYDKKFKKIVNWKKLEYLRKFVNKNLMFHW